MDQAPGVDDQGAVREEGLPGLVGGRHRGHVCPPRPCARQGVRAGADQGLGFRAAAHSARHVLVLDKASVQMSIRGEEEEKGCFYPGIAGI